MVSLLAFGALASYPALATSRLAAVLWALGASAWVALALALATRRALAVPWPVALFGAQYALFLVLRGGHVDANAPYVAAGLVATAELAYAAADRVPGRIEHAVVALRAGTLLGALAATVLLGEGILVLAGSGRAQGLALQAAGVLAAVAAVAAAVRIALSRPG